MKFDILQNFETYKAPWIFRNPHINTIYPHLLRKYIKIDFSRTRIQTHDGDFIDLDMAGDNGQKVVVLLHGLEGSSNSHYIKGMSRTLLNSGFDVVVMNQKGCSGELNKLYSSYHSGKTDDLHEVLEHINAIYHYQDIVIVGFSLGANICLKYAGERGEQLKICAVIAISVPSDLEESADYLAKTSNILYMKRFMRMLRSKTKDRIKAFPNNGLTENKIDECRTFQDFDDMYTAPAHGFTNAHDYWNKSSSKQFIEGIRKPTLIINALDDPFFGTLSHPVNEVKNNDCVNLIQPKNGGHVGFSGWNLNKSLWHERVVLKFIQLNLS